MSSREARANFADLLGLVYYTKEPVIVEKKGKPVAVVVVSPEDCERYQKAEKERLFQTIHAIQERNKGEDPADIEADIAKALEEVRQEEDAARQATTKGHQFMTGSNPHSAVPRGMPSARTGCRATGPVGTRRRGQG